MTLKRINQKDYETTVNEIEKSLTDFLREKERDVNLDNVSRVSKTTAQIISDTLGLDYDEITSDSSFYFDLGAESIDYLDMKFRSEKELGVRIDNNGIIDFENLYSDDKRFKSHGFEDLILSEEGLRYIRENFSYIYDTLEDKFREELDKTGNLSNLERGANVLSMAVRLYDVLEENSRNPR